MKTRIRAYSDDYRSWLRSWIIVPKRDASIVYKRDLIPLRNPVTGIIKYW